MTSSGGRFGVVSGGGGEEGEEDDCGGGGVEEVEGVELVVVDVLLVMLVLGALLWPVVLATGWRPPVAIRIPVVAVVVVALLALMTVLRLRSGSSRMTTKYGLFFGQGLIVAGGERAPGWEVLSSASSSCQSVPR